MADLVDDRVVGGETVAREAVARALGGLEAPGSVLAVLGNHDWLFDGHRVGRALRDAGIPVLENDAREVAVGGGRLWVAGVGRPDRARRADLDAALAAVPDGAPVLLLSHNPVRLPARAGARGAHRVGSHPRRPGRPAARREKVIPSRYGDRYAEGHVVEGGRHLYVYQWRGNQRLAGAPRPAARGRRADAAPRR